MKQKKVEVKCGVEEAISNKFNNLTVDHHPTYSIVTSS